MDRSKNKNKGEAHKVNLILIGVLFSAFYWVLEAVRDVIGFERGNLLGRIFYPDAMSMWVRLLVVFIIILFSAYVETLRKKTKADSTGSGGVLSKFSMAWIALVFGLLYWILEAVRDVFVYQKENLLRQIFTPDPMGFWMRFLGIGVLILLGIHVQNTIKAEKQKEKALENEMNETLEELKNKNTELKKENGRLRIEIETASKDSGSKDSAMWEWGDLYYNNTHMMVKSNLQNISRLMDLKKTFENNNKILDILNETSTKIYTLSLVHSQIVNDKSFDKINLGQYIKNLVQYLSNVFISKNVQTRFEFEDAYLPIQYAFPCAFVLDELITNAYRHAYQNGNKGYLTIRLNKTDNRYSIQVCDDGVGMPTGFNADDSQNVGLKWAGDIVKNQLKGNLLFASDEGTEVTVEFRAD